MKAGGARSPAIGLHRKEYQPGPAGALEGIRVLDLSKLVAGNQLTQVLGDFGADVVKIEPLSGDTLRAWKVCDVSTNWKLYARNKKSIGLDFRSPPAREILLELARHAQVFVESFRPGTLEKMGLEPQRLWDVNPKLVIVRISGWGQDGPYARRPGFGTLVEGVSGFAALNGFGDREPVLPPMYLADSVAGLFGATGVLAALRDIEIHGGAGQVVDLPLLDPMIAVLGPQAAHCQLTGRVRPRTGSRSSNIAPRNAYRCSDGRWVALSAATQGMAERLFRAIGRPDLLTDPAFRDNASRLAHVEALDAILSEFIGQRSQQDNVTFFEQAEVSIGAIYDTTQVIADPHVLEREIITAYPDDDMGCFPMHHPVPRLSGTPASIRTPAPALGEHSVAELRAAGFADERIAAWVQSGYVVAGSPA